MAKTTKTKTPSASAPPPTRWLLFRSTIKVTDDECSVIETERFITYDRAEAVAKFEEQCDEVWSAEAFATQLRGIAPSAEFPIVALRLRLVSVASGGAPMCIESLCETPAYLDRLRLHRWHKGGRVVIAVSEDRSTVVECSLRAHSNFSLYGGAQYVMSSPGKSERDEGFDEAFMTFLGLRG